MSGYGNRTEQHLWHALRDAVRVVEGARFTRFENALEVGVSDVEYVLRPWHGWVELKVSATVREASPLRFGHELTAEQCSWLLAHHYPRRYLRSWVLVGMYGRGLGWKGFMLLPATSTTQFLRSTQPSVLSLRAQGHLMHRDMTSVVRELVNN